MNRNDKRELEGIMVRLDIIRDELREIAEAEQSKIDSWPESLQNCERADRMRAAIDCLDSAVDNIGNARTDIEESMEQ